MKENRCRHDITDEFGKFYEDHFEDIYKYVYRKIPNTQVAEDITQDTFYVAFVKFGEVLAHPDPERWLKRAAYNKMLELYRRMKYWVTVPLEQEELEVATEELLYEVTEMELTALVTLNEGEWSLLRNYYLCGYTIQELARSEGITENNMRVRLSRLKSKLSDRVK